MTLKDMHFSTSDLYNEIEKKNFPSWTWFVQLMPEKDAADTIETYPVERHEYPMMESMCNFCANAFS